MDIERKLAEARKRKGLTQKELSELSFKSVDVIKSYETGRTSISVSELHDLCDALEISIVSVLVDDPNDILNIVKEYYNLDDKKNYNIEKDFNMIMQGFIERYKK